MKKMGCSMLHFKFYDFFLLRLNSNQLAQRKQWCLFSLHFFLQCRSEQKIATSEIKKESKLSKTLWYKKKIKWHRGRAIHFNRFIMFLPHSLIQLITLSTIKIIDLLFTELFDIFLYTEPFDIFFTRSFLILFIFFYGTIWIIV